MCVFGICCAWETNVTLMMSPACSISRSSQSASIRFFFPNFFSVVTVTRNYSYACACPCTYCWDTSARFCMYLIRCWSTSSCCVVDVSMRVYRGGGYFQRFGGAFWRIIHIIAGGLGRGKTHNTTQEQPKLMPRHDFWHSSCTHPINVHGYCAGTNGRCEADGPAAGFKP